jgi:hypothetical protein
MHIQSMSCSRSCATACRTTRRVEPRSIGDGRIGVGMEDRDSGNNELHISVNLSELRAALACWIQRRRSGLGERMSDTLDHDRLVELWAARLRAQHDYDRGSRGAIHRVRRPKRHRPRGHHRGAA